NASNDAIYNVTFSNGGGTAILNTDQGSLHNIVSLVFAPNLATFQLDLLAADNQGGLIVRYPGDFHPGSPTTGTVIFTAGGAGPAYPDGLSVDGAGDLYVLNASPGSASDPQLWVLPSNGTGGFASPVLIDANYAATESLADTLVASTTVVPPGGTQPVVTPGDVLVVTTSRGTIYQYHLTPNETPSVFASGLGNGQFKIRTGIQAGHPYAYVANN